MPTRSRSPRELEELVDDFAAAVEELTGRVVLAVEVELLPAPHHAPVPAIVAGAQERPERSSAAFA